MPGPELEKKKKKKSLKHLESMDLTLLLKGICLL